MQGARHPDGNREGDGKVEAVGYRSFIHGFVFLVGDSHQLAAPVVLLSRAKVARAGGCRHRVKFLANRALFFSEEDFAERMPISREEVTGFHRDREKRGACKSARRLAIVRAAVEAPNPSFRSSVNFTCADPHDHFARRIEPPNSREALLRLIGLVRYEAHFKGPLLTVDPLVKSAAHAAAAIVVDFDPIRVQWEFHLIVSFVFSVFTESYCRGFSKL